MIVFPSINETCADPQRGKGSAPPKKLQLAKVFLQNAGTDPIEKEKSVIFFQWTPPPPPHPYRKFLDLRMRCIERTHFKAQSHYLHTSLGNDDLLTRLFIISCNCKRSFKSGGGGGGGGTQIFSYIRRLGSFLGVQNFEFHFFFFFWGGEFRKMNTLGGGGYEDFVDIFWGHHKIGLY